MLGQLAGPATLLADAGQAHRSALLAAKTGAGDAPVAQAGGSAVDRPAVAAVGAGDLDGKLVAGEVAEGRAGSGHGHCSLRWDAGRPMATGRCIHPLWTLLRVTITDRVPRESPLREGE